MLVQRFIAVCDEFGCKKRTKVRVTIILKPVKNSLRYPVVLQPDNIVFGKDGWLWGWDGSKTAIYCPEHSFRLSEKKSSKVKKKKKLKKKKQ